MFFRPSPVFLGLRPPRRSRPRCGCLSACTARPAPWPSAGRYGATRASRRERLESKAPKRPRRRRTSAGPSRFESCDSTHIVTHGAVKRHHICKCTYTEGAASWMWRSERIGILAASYQKCCEDFQYEEFIWFSFRS